ncbi:hypothetical protein CI102_12570, partial [Trichoderma harzianum]
RVTVFHDLHCLNGITPVARFLYSWSCVFHLGDKNMTLTPFLYTEHCIDALRLSLMCTGDMTLIPIRWSKNRNWINPSFDTDHTCRNYEALRDWSLPRDAADENKWPANADRLRKLDGLS